MSAIKKHEFETETIDGEFYLVETREIEGLVDHKNQHLAGRAVNKTYYPETSARVMIRELERQLSEASIGVEAKENQIKSYEEKNAPVDMTFKKKFDACVARMQIDQTTMALKNERAQYERLSKELDTLKGVAPSLFQ